MPDQLVWNLAFRATIEEMLARRIFANLLADPHVQSASWFTDSAVGENPSIIQMTIVFQPGFEQPARHELRGLNRIHPGENLPATRQPSTEKSPPVLSNGFRIGEWARKKNHSAVYKIVGFAVQPWENGDPLVQIVHVDTGESMTISIPHLLVAYEPLTHPPRLTTWQEQILEEDPFG